MVNKQYYFHGRYCSLKEVHQLSRTKISLSTLKYRLRGANMTLQEALSLPPKTDTTTKYVDYLNEKMTVSDAIKKSGVDVSLTTIKKLLKTGKTFEESLEHFVSNKKEPMKGYYDGEYLTVSEAIQKSKQPIAQQIVYTRINNLGYSFQEAIDGKEKTVIVMYKGVELTLKQAIAASGLPISYAHLYKKIVEEHMTFDDAVNEILNFRIRNNR